MNRLLAVLLVVGSVSALAQPRTRAHKDVKPEAVPERTLLRPARLDFEGSKLTGQLNTAEASTSTTASSSRRAP